MKKVLTSTIVLIILTSAIFAQTNRRNHRSKPAQIAIDQVHTHDPVMAKEGDTYYLFFYWIWSFCHVIQRYENLEV